MTFHYLLICTFISNLYKVSNISCNIHLLHLKNIFIQLVLYYKQVEQHKTYCN